MIVTLPQAPLALRKALAVSVALARLVGGARASNLTTVDQAQLVSLADAVQGTLVRESAKQEDLDAFTAGRVAALKALTPTLSPNLSANAQRMLADTFLAIGAPRCASCHGRSIAGTSVCSDHPDDFATIAAGANCLAEIDQTIRFARVLAENLLTDAFGVRQKLAVRLQTRFRTGAQTAACRHQKTATPSDVVILYLPPGGFDFSGLASVPYLISHEVICHATQDLIGPNTRMRSASGWSCPWTEGWMDCLAAEAVQDSLRGNAPGLPIPIWVREEDSRIAMATDNLQKSRLVDTDAAMKIFADQRSQAAQAWWKFVQVALGTGLNEDEAKRLRRRFSMIYNAQSRSAAERQRIGTKLSVRLVGGNGGDHKQIVDAADDLVRRKDASRFAAIFS